MKINFLSFTSHRGGAAKATLRLIKALEKKNITIEWFTVEKNLNKYSFVQTPDFSNRIIHKFFWYLSQLISVLFTKNKETKQSLNLFGSSFCKKVIKNSSLIHVHWINNETLSIYDFKLLSGKSIITLHDEWFYCGSEHHALDDETFSKVIYGVDKFKKVFDVSDKIFILKEKKYKFIKDVIFTVPSSWMKERAQQSLLLKGFDIRVVPNPITVNIFRHKESDNIVLPEFFSEDDFIILFGGVDGDTADIKGFSILLEALNIISKEKNDYKNLKIITFGSRKKGYTNYSGIPAFSFGYIKDENLLAQLYSLSSITVVPSKAESFGQVAAESLSCETPVLAFNYSGLTDIVKHKKNGYLAAPFLPSSLAEGIKWLYNLDKNELNNLGRNGRKHIGNNFSEKIVGEKLLKLYQEILEKNLDKLKNKS
jgi:glycosyltransferase involved in cell wall biosynthesis